MPIDQERIRAILKVEHFYYGWHDIPIRRDERWIPTWENIIAPQLSPTMHVLDVGCGNGHFLLDLSPSFHCPNLTIPASACLRNGTGLRQERLKPHITSPGSLV